MKKISKFFKSLILDGLFTILPFAATIFLIQFLYRTLQNWLQPLHDMLPIALQKIYGSELVIIILFLFLIGALLKFFVIESTLSFFEGTISKIPIIRTIYSSFKTLVDFFNVPDPAKERKKVVLIQFPKRGSFSIAFLLESAEDSYQKVLPQDDNIPPKKFVKVFMPGSPNPTTGFFFIVPERDVIPTNITFEEAIKIIVSCGLISPTNVK